MRRALPPLIIVAVSLFAAWAMILSHEPPRAAGTVDMRPWAEVVRAVPSRVRLSVETQGSVEPRMESDLVAEVAGRVVEVAGALQAGGVVAAGDVLVRIDDRDYRNALARARATRDRARSELDVRSKSRQRTASLADRGLASQSTLDDVINGERIARANLADANAALAKAELDLQRTVVRAPFDGRVRQRRVGAGQFVTPGERLARLYAVDAAEVRLPLSVDDLAFLDLPLTYAADSSDVAPPEVRLHAEVAGRAAAWTGRIVRTEGVLDPVTREVVAVARVGDPFSLAVPTAERGTPLAPGLFVRAEVLGREVADVFVLPAAAHRPGIGLLVVDDEGRLEFRDVEVLRRDARRVYVASGVEAGERVVASALESPIDGMRVRVDEVPNDAAVDTEAAP